MKNLRSATSRDVGPKQRTFEVEVSLAFGIGRITEKTIVPAKTVSEVEDMLKAKYSSRDYKIESMRVM